MIMERQDAYFEWNLEKEQVNIQQHGVSFTAASAAFLDEYRIIAEDIKHSDEEKRYYCFGRVSLEILTVRFTIRKKRIRIIGAGYWRKGKKIYEQENKNDLH
jgi:uncharacterized DUF497 family protein